MVTGSDIKKARQRAGLSQAALAQELGVSQRTIGGWERGEVSPGAAEQRLVDLLELDAPSAENDLEQIDDLDLLAEVARRLARARKKEGMDSGTSAEKSLTDDIVPATGTVLETTDEASPST